MNDRQPDIIDRIAEAASCTAESVKQVLNDFDLDLTPRSRRHRSLRLDRLRIRGTKAGDFESGPFDESFTFGFGVTVIAADNLRGKTSILEIITLMLRGERRNLQADVLSWLEEISLDVHINEQPLGFRVSLADSEITSGCVLSGKTTDLLDSDDVAAASTAELLRADSSEEWAERIGAFMMTQLDLERIQVFNRARNDDEAGSIKAHGWPAYFSVLYPPSGADTVLLGSTAGDQLPVRLMQIFLDMPEASRSMRVTALAKRLESEHQAERRRDRDTTAVLQKQLQAALERRKLAYDRLAKLDQEEPAESLEVLTQLASVAGEALGTARQAFGDASQAFIDAQSGRVADEKALNTLREAKAASDLFHGLNPKSCPRCEAPIGDERRVREQHDHHCAVCDTTLEVGDDDYAERESQAVDALAATRAAERALAAAKSQAQLDLSSSQAELDSIQARIVRAESAHQLSDRIEAEHELAAAIAVVEALEGMETEEPALPTAVVILNAASELLRGEIAQVSADLYAELSEGTRDLALSFGIAELEAIRIKANGTMDVTKGGGAKSSFSSQSPGERLRLRYALVVALLRTARHRDIAGHPGLLLLDSLKAEEVQDDHAQTLLRGLVASAAEEPGLQILVTTADKELAASVPGVAKSITAKPERTTLF